MIAVNNSSNLHLRSGIAPLAAMREAAAAGPPSASTARRSTRTTTRCASCGSRSCCTPAPASRAVAAGGPPPGDGRPRARLGQPGLSSSGTVAANEPADLLLLDWAALEDDGLRDGLDPVPIVLSRAPPRGISASWSLRARPWCATAACPASTCPALRDELMARLRAGIAQSKTLRHRARRAGARGRDPFRGGTAVLLDGAPHFAACRVGKGA